MAERKRRPWGRRTPAEELRQAEHALDEARAQHAEQARKREQETEGVIHRMERLAEGNHLAALVWDVVTGGGGQQ